MSKIIINGKSDGSLKAYVNGNEVNGIAAGGSKAYTRMETGESPEPPAEPKYLCFEPAGNADIEVAMSRVGSPGFSPVLYISGNGEDWTSWSLNPITIHPGSKLYLYGENNTFGLDRASYWKFYFYGQVRASGDVTTLLTKNGTRTLQTDYIFTGLFQNCTGLVTAPELPATTLTNYCYYNMFQGCTSLTTAPALPATTLADSCYFQMFEGCTALTTAPELPATTLAQHCYGYMFKGCTSLINTPESLPATTLERGCYTHLFLNCTSLTSAPELPATTLAQYCYEFMFSGCTSLTSAPELPATTLAESCYYYMFYGCTSLTAAPALNAMALPDQCYYYMFKNCTSLTTAPKLPATTITGSGCYQGMFWGCTSLTTIACAASLYVQYMADNWTDRVAANGTFYKNPIAFNWPTGSNGIPNGWTVGNYNDYQG